MHSKILAGSLVLISFSAFAQGVTIYGIVDTSVEYLTNVSASGGKLVRLPTLMIEGPTPDSAACPAGGRRRSLESSAGCVGRRSLERCGSRA